MPQDRFTYSSIYYSRYFSVYREAHCAVRSVFSADMVADNGIIIASVYIASVKKK
jgi:hypothetical protein